MSDSQLKADRRMNKGRLAQRVFRLAASGADGSNRIIGGNTKGQVTRPVWRSICRIWNVVLRPGQRRQSDPMSFGEYAYRAIMAIGGDPKIGPIWQLIHEFEVLLPGQVWQLANGGKIL
jgi:hypothetical protein